MPHSSSSREGKQSLTDKENCQLNASVEAAYEDGTCLSFFFKKLESRGKKLEIVICNKLGTCYMDVLILN